MGSRLRCFGEIRTGASGLEMYHPEYRKVDDSVLTPVEEALTPIYPTTEGLNQARFRALTENALLALESGTLNELLPEDILHRWRLPPLNESVRYLHRPPVDADTESLAEGTHPAQRRLAFEELLAHHLSLQKLRQKTREKGRHKCP